MTYKITELTDPECPICTPNNDNKPDLSLGDKPCLECELWFNKAHNKFSNTNKKIMKFENKYFLARYLRGLWEKQKGKCAISGLELNKGNPMTIHIDREKGGRSSLYIENNIQLTMGIFNIAKNSNATEDFLIEMCRSIIHHIKKPSEHGQVLLQQLLEIKGELNIYNRQEEPGEIAERILTGKDMSKEE